MSVANGLLVWCVTALLRLRHPQVTQPLGQMPPTPSSDTTAEPSASFGNEATKFCIIAV